MSYVFVPICPAHYESYLSHTCSTRVSPPSGIAHIPHSHSEALKNTTPYLDNIFQWNSSLSFNHFFPSLPTFLTSSYLLRQIPINHETPSQIALMCNYTGKIYKYHVLLPGREVVYTTYIVLAAPRCILGKPAGCLGFGLENTSMRIRIGKPTGFICFH